MSHYKQTFRRVDYLSLDNFEELVLEIKSCEYKWTISNIIKFNTKDIDGYLEMKYNLREEKIKVEELFEEILDIMFSIFRYSSNKSKYYFKKLQKLVKL